MKSIARSLRAVHARDARANDFRIHAKRWRLIRPKEGLVYRLRFWLTRWMCCKCEKTMTHYPPGVLPHKQYEAKTILSTVERYLPEPEVSYAEVVKENGLPIVHAGTAVATEDSSEEAKEAEDEAPHLSPSTPWRWIRTLAALWASLKPRWERRQIAADGADLSAWQIAPRKYRSQSRMQELVDCGRVVAVLRNTTDFASLGLSP